LNAYTQVTELYGMYADAVYRLCYSYLKSAPDAQDAVQSTFMKLLGPHPEFNDDGHAKAWLFTCASNLCKDALRAAARRQTTEMPDQVVDPTASTETNDVLEAVQSLPEPYRACVHLYYYEGYRTDEIAAITGTPPSTVRNRLKDARAQLKSAVER